MKSLQLCRATGSRQMYDLPRTVIRELPSLMNYVKKKSVSMVISKAVQTAEVA